MTEPKLTDSELLMLGLIAEMPRHGYELEHVIEKRGMREWTQIGFSSIYFVLGKLEAKGLVVAAKQANAKAKKSFSITDEGLETLSSETLGAIGTIRTSTSPLIMGMLHWPVPSRKKALAALQKRAGLIERELARIEGIRFEQQPLPDYVDAIFDYSLNQLLAESAWIAKTLDYMKTKP
jgi:DNA-binding PadR family transcriptional regulator